MTIRAWQLAFLAGIVLCLVAAVLALGAVWTLGITGVTAVGVRVITALIGPNESPVTVLQRTLNVSARLRFATAGVFVISGVFIGIAIWRTYTHLNEPPPPPPFRVSYFLLENYAADLLLQRKIEPAWEPKLAGESYLVPNSVFQTVNHLERTFPDRLPELGNGLWVSKPRGKHQTAAPDNENTTGPAQNIETRMRQGDTVFAGNVLYSDRGIPLEELPRYIRSLKDPGRPWKLFGHHDGPIGGLIFRTYAERSDLELLAESRYKQFEIYLAREGTPPDFGYVDIYEVGLGDCGGSEEGSTTVIDFVGRTPKLRVAVVENITDQPIKLGKFTFKENPTIKLRSREDDALLLAQQTSRQTSFFPAEMLKPGERIVIPIELLMGFRDTDDMGEAYASFSDLSEDPSLLNQFRDSQPIELTGVNGKHFAVDSGTLNRILGQQSAKFPLNEEYVYGPSIRIENLEVANVTYPFREFDASRLVITEGLAMGSCPFVYTFSSPKQAWVREGVILYGLSARRKETLDVRSLQNFDGRLLIREEEDEQSFIDSLFVKAISVDGRQMILPPRNNSLKVADGRYVKLSKGDELLVEFEVPRDLIAGSYFVGAIGFYLPDTPGKSGNRVHHNSAKTSRR